MASHRRTHQPQLNYFQQAPVRGQLEPLSADGYSRTGWRWLQCTDTPNELRVLLPPRTALVYAHILRVEAAELAKDREASWDRIMQIRHLKDRMIRKCQRLAKGSVPQDRSTSHPMFLTIHAPPDFRLKEMERWFRDQGADITQGSSEGPTRPYCCDKCSPPAHVVAPLQTAPRRVTASSGRTTARVPDRARRASVSQSANPASTSQRKHAKSRAQPLPVQVRSRHAERAPNVRRSSTPSPLPTPHRSRSVSPYHGSRAGSSLARANVRSPDPVPIPFRSSTMLDEGHLAFVDSPEPMDRSVPVSPEPEPVRPSSPNSTLVDAPADDKVPFPAPGPELETIHEGPEDPESSHRPTLPRRRSSLKKSGSMSRLSVISQTKSVTWAMDRAWEEQVTKYTKAVDEADAVAHELDGAREAYHNHVAEMRRLCRNVIQASEKVRLESENLHQQEDVMRSQEDTLMECCNRLERMELQYREKVLGILEETKRIVQLCDK
ncbi:unnamed protein product [Somion occarium]|uniref:Uncharacterized protein n=1 Tax=Somion occarium TaxID=3059160 RepID=A0ABP1CJ17_9APHY